MSQVQYRVLNTGINSHLEGVFALHPWGENYNHQSDEIFVALLDNKVVAIASVNGSTIECYSRVADDDIKARLLELARMHVSLIPSTMELLEANRNGDESAGGQLHKRLSKFIDTCVFKFTRNSDSNDGAYASCDVREALPGCEAKSLDELTAWTAIQVRKSVQRAHMERRAAIVA